MNSQFQQMFINMENTMRGIEQQMNQLRSVFGQPQNPYPQYQNPRGSNQMMPITIIDILIHADDKLLVKSTTGNGMQGDVICSRQDILMHLSNTGSVGTQISTMVLNNPMLTGMGLRGWIITDNQAILTVPLIGSAVFDPAFIHSLPCVSIKDLRVKPMANAYGSPFGNQHTAQNTTSWVCGIIPKELGKFELSTITYSDPSPKTVVLTIAEIASELDKLTRILEPQQFNTPSPAGHTTAWIFDDRNALISIVPVGSCMIHPEALAKIPGVRVHDLRPKQEEGCMENGDTVNPTWVTEMTPLGEDRWSVKQVTAGIDDRPTSLVCGLQLKENVVEHNIESLMELAVGDEYQSMQFDSLLNRMKPENLKVWKLNSDHVLVSIELFGCGIFSTGILSTIPELEVIDVTGVAVATSEEVVHPYIYDRNDRVHPLESMQLSDAVLIDDKDHPHYQHYKLTYLRPSLPNVMVYVPKKDLTGMLIAEFSPITAQGLRAAINRQNNAATNQSNFTVVDIESVGQSIVQVMNGNLINTYFLVSKSVKKAFAKLTDDTYLRNFEI